MSDYQFARGVTRTVVASADTDSNRVVALTGDNAGAAADASSTMLFGIVHDGAYEGDNMTVFLSGTALAAAGGAFSQGAFLTADANGKVVEATGDGTDAIIGRAMSAASAEDDVIEVQILQEGATRTV